MINRKMHRNTKGFTLIELMIVIAIIGILAAIAIPNFIAYRNKAFCSATEADANSIASAVASYFSSPSRTSIETDDIDVSTSNGNTYTISATDPNVAITITVTDASGRCPDDYQDASDDWTDDVFTKVIEE